MIRRSLSGLFAGALLALSVGVATATPAAADAAGDCLTEGNVWVIVQNPQGTRTGCASSFGTGEQALRSAGMSFEQNSTGLICRINGYPETCPEKPMPYWAYHHAPAGGSWAYATEGAAGRSPGPGTVEGWRYGAGAAPGVSPPTATAPKPSTTAQRPTTQAPKQTGAPKQTASGPTGGPKRTSAPKQTGTRTQAGAPKSSATSSSGATKRARRSTQAPPGSASRKPTGPTSREAGTTPSGRGTPARTPGTPATPGTATASPTGAAASTPGAPASAGPSGTDASTTATALPSAEPPVATVVEDDSPNGLLVTAGLVGAAAAGTTGALWFRRRGGLGG